MESFRMCVSFPNAIACVDCPLEMQMCADERFFCVVLLGELL